MKKTCLILVTLNLLLLAGCRSPKPATEKPTNTTNQVQTSKTEYYEGTFDGSYQGIKVSGLVRMEKDKMIWVSLSKFIEMGRATATPDSVHVYIKLLGSYFHGTYADVEKKTGVKTDFASLQKLLFKKAETLNQTSQACLPHYKSQICVDVRFTKFKRSTSPLTFPMNIPSSAKPLFK